MSAQYTKFTPKIFYKGNDINIELKQPHTKYLDKVLSRHSYEELMWLFCKAGSPSKEITESYAALSNLKKVCQVSDYSWLHIGDGGYARTGAIFAFMTKSINISIDPDLNMEYMTNWKVKHNVKKLGLAKCKFQDLYNHNEYTTARNRPHGIVCVHAHVNLEEIDRHFPNWKYLYTNPCCKPNVQRFNEKYLNENNIEILIHRDDWGIFSQYREVIIYKKNERG